MSGTKTLLQSAPYRTGSWESTHLLRSDKSHHSIPSGLLPSGQRGSVVYLFSNTHPPAMKMCTLLPALMLKPGRMSRHPQKQEASQRRGQLAVWPLTSRESPVSSTIPHHGSRTSSQVLREKQGQLGIPITEVTFPAGPFQEESCLNRRPERQMLPIPWHPKALGKLRRL